jgi:hypothetical protein
MEKGTRYQDPVFSLKSPRKVAFDHKPANHFLEKILTNKCLDKHWMKEFQ